MTFFHASQTKNIKILKSNISNHNIPLIYFSDKRENVLVYLSNAIEKFCKEKHFKFEGFWHKCSNFSIYQLKYLQIYFQGKIYNPVPTNY